MAGHWDLSASDLTHLYEGCRYCFALKLKHRIVQPTVPLPGVFAKIASLQKDAYVGRRTTDLSPAMPPGSILAGEKKVRSEPLAVPGSATTVSVGGRFDLLAELADGTHAVFDAKTAKPAAGKTALYGRQLHAYALALERPAEGYLRVAPVSTLGLLYAYPASSALDGRGTQTFAAALPWAPVPRDDGGFLAFLGEVVRTLDAPRLDPRDCAHCAHCRGGGRCRAGRAADDEAPRACDCCPWCVYRAATAGDR